MSAGVFVVWYSTEAKKEESFFMVRVWKMPEGLIYGATIVPSPEATPTWRYPPCIRIERTFLIYFSYHLLDVKMTLAILLSKERLFHRVQLPSSILLLLCQSALGRSNRSQHGLYIFLLMTQHVNVDIFDNNLSAIGSIAFPMTC